MKHETLLLKSQYLQELILNQLNFCEKIGPSENLWLVLNSLPAGLVLKLNLLLAQCSGTYSVWQEALKYLVTHCFG